MLNNAPTSDDLPSVESSDGPISIQITSSDNSMEHVKEEAASISKLPAVSKVHIKHEEERRSSSEDEMTVKIYNVTKSVVTVEKQTFVTEKQEVVTVEKQSKVEEAKDPIIKEVEVEIVKETIQQKTPVKPVEVKSVAKQEIKAPVKLEEIVKVVKREAETPPKEDDLRPTSPLWTYTLPAPPVFADSSVVNKVAPTDHNKSGDKYFSDFVSTDCNETILSDSNTTVISAETQIHPIIVDRKPRDESFILSTKSYTKHTEDDESDKSTEIITSDVEDGYLGNGKMVKVDSPPPPRVVEAQSFKKEIVIEDFQRSRLLISRSDSFHSIGQARNFDAGLKRTGPYAPPKRSTSFLSLVQSQKAESRSSRPSSDNVPYSRQKSTSELSISEAPSLQSLEVLRNILNSSRKNSLHDASPKEEKSFVVKHKEVVAELVTKQVEFEKKPEKIPEKQTSIPIVEVKPAETQWRYSGPPKINLGTWSERPKVEVAIAADSDYKFGGVTATLPRDLRNKPETTNKRHTIHISNEHAVEEKVEKFTKPKVLGVEYKKDVTLPVVKDPSPEIVTKPMRTIINIKPRPMSMDMSNSYSTIVTSTSSITSPSSPSSVSYNRLSSNANKFTPVVHGFKLGNIKESDQVVEPTKNSIVTKQVEVSEKKPSPAPTIPAKPAFIRSTSFGDINRNSKFTIVAETKNDDEVDNHFSQTGLRKTGLKEKILLHDKNTKSIFGRVVEPNQEKSFVRQNNQENHMSRSLSHPTPPKPPPPPMMSYRKSAPVDVDTRHELLDAIKSFKKDSLRHK